MHLIVHPAIYPSGQSLPWYPYLPTVFWGKNYPFSKKNYYISIFIVIIIIIRMLILYKSG